MAAGPRANESGWFETKGGSMERKFSRFFMLMGLAALPAVWCFGQTQTARLQGIVHDASGANVPAARIIVVNTQTRVASETSSNASGLYVLPALTPGTYVLTAEAAGFRKTSVADIILDVSGNVAQDITLEIGAVSEVLEVKANVVAVTT